MITSKNMSKGSALHASTLSSLEKVMALSDLLRVAGQSKATVRSETLEASTIMISKLTAQIKRETIRSFRLFLSAEIKLIQSKENLAKLGDKA